MSAFNTEYMSVSARPSDFDSEVAESRRAAEVLGRRMGTLLGADQAQNQEMERERREDAFLFSD